MNNPIEFLQAIKNPKEAVMKLAATTSNPMINNLIKMANKNDIKGLETFARNLCKERNIDFDKDFANFMSTFK